MILKNDNERYHASYFKWLMQTMEDFKSMAEDILSLLISEEALGFIVFSAILLTFPVSLPLIALSRKLRIKKVLEKQHGKEAFKKEGK